jgi:F-type H+-transporting ATPase subunit delta
MLWDTTPALSRSLESPLIPADKKHAIIDQIFGKEADPLTRSFLHLLITKRREDILRTVEEEFQVLSDQARGLIRAEATVAAPLSEADRAALVDGLKTRTGKQIELDVRVDPVILGGVVVRMQDTVIDGSVRGALERLREQMLLER